VDRKIRISFFPTDASKVRFLAFSTRLAVAFMALAIPLSLGGYWLMVTGTLRDDHQVALQHKRSQRQTRLLEEHLSHLRMVPSSRVVAKFRSLADPVIGQANAKAVIQQVQELTDLARIEMLTSRLALNG
jgi:hypothetical protein